MIIDEYPAWICAECGRKHGKREPMCATYHDGNPNDLWDKCGWCGSRKTLTEPRDYGYPKPPAT
jgi:hypothetical protein